MLPGFLLDGGVADFDPPQAPPYPGQHARSPFGPRRGCAQAPSSPGPQLPPVPPVVLPGAGDRRSGASPASGGVMDAAAVAAAAALPPPPPPPLPPPGGGAPKPPPSTAPAAAAREHDTWVAEGAAGAELAHATAGGAGDSHLAPKHAGAAWGLSLPADGSGRAGKDYGPGIPITRVSSWSAFGDESGGGRTVLTAGMVAAATAATAEAVAPGGGGGGKGGQAGGQEGPSTEVRSPAGVLVAGGLSALDGDPRAGSPATRRRPG